MMINGGLDVDGDIAVDGVDAGRVGVGVEDDKGGEDDGDGICGTYTVWPCFY